MLNALSIVPFTEHFQMRAVVLMITLKGKRLGCLLRDKETDREEKQLLKAL